MSTTGVGRSQRSIDAVCWECGALALPECAYALKLVAWPRQGLPALGYPVKRGDRQDEVTVHVPRCCRCRIRRRIEFAITVATTLIGEAFGATGYAIFGPVRTPRPGDSGPISVGHFGGGAGLLLGFIAATLIIAAERRAAGRRPLTSYPPVLILWEAGWRKPVSSG
jgi:hypothetical protein